MSPPYVSPDVAPSPPRSHPTLVVLAAGLSTRYGAVKPLAAVGPQGESLMDYSFFDAARSGYGGAVVVVREEIEDAVSRHVTDLTAGSWPCAVVRQRLDDVPAGMALSELRTRPWGTGHAVWTARHLVRGPFTVVNADDFYGRAALETAARHAARLDVTEALALTYELSDTLSTNARVSRAILQVGSEGEVRGIREVLRVHEASSGIVGDTPDGTPLVFTGDEPVSMGLWGFTPGILPLLEGRFLSLLRQATDEGPPEFYLSDALHELIASGAVRMRAVASGLPSFGVTFADDRSRVRSRIERLVAEGHYPTDLRSAFLALTTRN